MNHNHDEDASNSKGTFAFIGFLLIAAYFLFSEHRAHFLGYLPYLLLLACPLLHMFGHHGHGAHGGKDKPTEQATASGAAVRDDEQRH